MKQAKQIRRLLVTLLAVAMLASALVIPSFALNEKVVYRLEPSTQSPEIGSIFTVTLKLRATRSNGNFNIPYLRFNLHYDPNFFEPLGNNGQGQALSKVDSASGQPSYVRFNGLDVGTEETGHFVVKDFTGDSTKYPTSGASGLNVLVVQWIAPIVSGVTQVLNVEAEGDGGTGTVILQLNFRVKDTAPLDGSAGTIAIFKNYSSANIPFYMSHQPDPSKSDPGDYVDYTPTTNNVDSTAFPVDVANARLSLKPSPHAPTLEVKPGAPVVIKELNAAQQAQYGYTGIIYGFPEKMTQQGTKTKWTDPQYAALGQPNAEWLYAEQIDGLLQTTNLGVLHVSNSSKPEHKWDYGTGSRLTLYDANKSQARAVYYFVVFGDVDGNMIVNLDDYVELKAMLAGLRGDLKLPGTSPSQPTSNLDPYETPYHLAAHVSAPNLATPLSGSDLQKIYNVAVGVDSFIDQKPILPVI
jgi:hypothetical protein